MSEQYLMARGTSESMNVPGEKLQEFIDDGWKVVSKKSTDTAPAPKAEAAPASGDPAAKKETKAERKAREAAEVTEAAAADLESGSQG